ncbi:MAG: DUF1501 domain-containing protein [Planctomycetota bacterium]
MTDNVLSASRRQFLQSAVAGSAGATLLQWQAAQKLLAQTAGSSGYKALVCLFLDGGNDSFNMLTPHTAAEYDAYRATRGEPGSGGVSIDRADLLEIAGPDGRTMGLHPSMTAVQQLYNDGHLGFIANVGSLIRPTTMTDYQAAESLPLGLFSHSDLTRHWQTAMPDTRAALTGWGGRMADLLTPSEKFNDTIGMSIAVDRVNTFQAADSIRSYIVNSSGAISRSGYFGNWQRDRIIRQAFDEILAQPTTDLVSQTYSQLTRQAIDAAQLYNDATASVTLETPFPEHYLGRNLERIARTIASADDLGHEKHIFFVSYGGWDHHGDLLGPQANLLGRLSESLKAFYDSLVELQVSDQVVLFTASDFGRTLVSNGQGTDHGWGGNQIVLGGPVNGGNLFGEYPQSLAENDLDVGRGRLIPTLSVDQYAAELAMWMGIGNDSNLESVLPNIRNFYPQGQQGPPIGFLNA